MRCRPPSVRRPETAARRTLSQWFRSGKEAHMDSIIQSTELFNQFSTDFW
jgi:hypothetical protein